MDKYAECYYRFIAGDEKAFEELLEAFGERLIFFINRFVNNYAVAEELMEDVFCELLINKNRFKGKSALNTYLFTIARNKAVDAVRKNIKLRQTEENFETAAEDDIALLEERLYYEQRGAVLHKAIDELSIDYRTALHLVYFEEMSYEEAAVIMKKNSRQIKNLIYRAKKQLRTLIVIEEI